MVGEKVAAVDAAWLRMDSDTQRMVITAAFRFAAPLSLAELRALVVERLLPQPRFRQRVVEAGVSIGTPIWEEVHALEQTLDAHLEELTLAGAGDAELAEALSRLAGGPLDRRRPLWALTLLQGHAEGPVLVARLHHALGDGVSLVRLLLALTDQLDDGSPAPASVGLPHKPLKGIVELGRAALTHTAALGRMLLLPPDPTTVLRGTLGPDKRVAWTRALPIERLRALAKRAGAKLNDVLVAVTAGALRAYLERRGGLPPERELRALVPVFLQGHGDGGLGNHFGMVFVPLLIGIADPHARLRASKRANDRVKASPDAAVAIEVLAAMGAAGPGVEEVGIDLFTRKASCMITNVPGPGGRLRLGGRPISDLMVWAPVAGHIGVGVSLLTYDGRVRVGVVTDARLVPDPERLATAWEAEVDALG